MTPRQARIALGGFLLLAAGVAANALFLQSKPTMATRAVIDRPLPRSAERARSPTEAAKPARPLPHPHGGGAAGQRTAHLDPSSARADILAEEAAEGEDSETVRAVQRELRHRGYGALVSDGVMRPVTRAAIMAYEHDAGLPLTGEASEAVLKRIVFGASEAVDPSAARTIASAHAAQVVRRVQELLTLLNYQPGAVDGRLGEATARAIREFEMDKGLPARGRISADVLMRLAEAAARPAAAR